MSQKPSTAAADAAPSHALERPAPAAQAALTPAQAHALERSAPLTPEQFKDLRRLAEHGVSPLRHL